MHYWWCSSTSANCVEGVSFQVFLTFAHRVPLMDLGIGLLRFFHLLFATLRAFEAVFPHCPAPLSFLKE